MVGLMNNIIVEYNGEYPNLCAGNLILTIDGTRWEFPDFCLTSGGLISYSGAYDEVERGEWYISEWPENFPDELKEAANTAVNLQVPHGCCGGCI